MESIKLNSNNAFNNVIDSAPRNCEQAKRRERLGGNAILWLSMHDINKAFEVLKECEEKADEYSGEIQHNLSLFFNKTVSERNRKQMICTRIFYFSILSK